MNEQKQAETNPWAGAEVICAYSRAQALEDGTLVDISEWAERAGFTMPVAVTREVWEVLEPSEALKADGQDVMGRVWDMFFILRMEIRRPGTSDEVRFAPLFTLVPDHEPEQVTLRAVCGPGDTAAPVITIMLLCS